MPPTMLPLENSRHIIFVAFGVIDHLLHLSSVSSDCTMRRLLIAILLPQRTRNWRCLILIKIVTTRVTLIHSHLITIRW